MKGDDTEVIPYVVTVLEVEWLEGKIPMILHRLMKSERELFDNLLIKILMAQLDFRREVIVSMFIPFCIYQTLLCYYYGFFFFLGPLPQEKEVGLFVGNPTDVVLRVIILILTAYLGGIELFQLTQVELKVYLKSY